MSSRFLKKVSDMYGKSENELKSDLSDENLSGNDTNNSFTVKNKFSLLSIDLTDNEEDSQIQTEIEKINENKTTTKPQKSKGKKMRNINKFQEMTEDEMMEMFSSMETETVKNKTDDRYDALMIQIRNLNENVELQQLFGPPTELPGSRNDQLRQRNHNPLMKFTFGKRNVNWPNVSFSKLGLKMELNESSENNSKWCVVSGSNDYIRAEKALKTTMRTGNFQDHLREYPYHINTLLQMASMLVHQEDFTMAADLWKRIFYVYETISPLGFSLLGSNSAGSLSKTKFALDYHHRLNRGIFIALFQWILYLCQKSCFNTALEYCKLLLSINVTNDPLAIILLIDDIAIRCDKYEFLIKFYDQFQNKKSLKSLPNYAFSMSICYFFKSSHKKKESCDVTIANEFLQNALCLFPSFLRNFAEHCNIQMNDRVIKSQFFSRNDDPDSLNILIQLYMKRSINFWKNSSVMSWVESNVNLVLDRLDRCSSSELEEIVKERTHVIEMYDRQPPLAIKRHLLLSGYGELVDRTMNGLPHLIFDPFPPANSEGGFDHYVENDSELQLNDSWLLNLLRSLSPSYDG